MPYQVTHTAIADVLILEPKVFGDARGFFFESYSHKDFEQATGLNVQFVQDNHSRSSQGVPAATTASASFSVSPAAQ